MQGLAALLFTAMMMQGSIAPLEEDERESTARPRLELELDLVITPPSIQETVMRALPLQDVIYVRNGWFGLSLTDELAVLVDVRTEGVPSSPDPARPMSRSSFSASLGIALSPWDE